MRALVYLIGAALAVMLLSAAPARAAGIDCARAANATDKLICGDPDLVSLDSQLAAAFAGALDRSLRPAQVRQGQVAWLKTRDACRNVACMRAAYSRRVDALAKMSDPPADCAGASTIAINQCAAEYSRRAELEMDRYLAAARARLSDEAKDGSQGAKQALAQLRASQAAWTTYRKAECDAVYGWWSDGTIRGAMYQGCWLETTKARTAAILSTWLGFMDSSLPLMPPPAP